MNHVRRRISGRPAYAGFCLMISLITLVGCGYHFAGGGGSFAPGVKTVFVDAFSNKTSEANAENIFRIAFSNEIVQGSRFKLAPSREEADAIFRGTIVSIQFSPLAYKTSSLSAEDRITAILEFSFEEKKSGRVLWTNKAFVGTADYRVTTAGETEINRKNALAKLATDTAERAYRLMLSDF